MSSLVQMIAWHWIGGMPLSKPITVWSTDTYMCHSFLPGLGIHIIKRSSHLYKNNPDTGEMMSLYFKHPQSAWKSEKKMDAVIIFRQEDNSSERCGIKYIVMLCFNQVQIYSCHTLGQCIKGDTDGICLSNLVRLFFWSHSNMVYLTVTRQYFKCNVIFITHI